jgi:uncharacterized membrane protein YhdT
MFNILRSMEYFVVAFRSYLSSNRLYRRLFCRSAVFFHYSIVFFPMVRCAIFDTNPCMFAATRMNNFKVALTNTSPASSPPLNGTTPCGQWPGVAPPGPLTVSCVTGLAAFRYVVITIPISDYLTICELQVFPRGLRTSCILSLLLLVAILVWCVQLIFTAVHTIVTKHTLTL